jgi:signal transduction histidine kinase
MTRSLRELVSGADAVTAGDLSRRLSHREDDEIGRVAVAFNNMTSSLRRTLREQSSRESLAAMGEFAASLAHEVRNPLTAVKIDLQYLEERIGEDEALRDPLLRSLREIDRLDATVGDALSVVRRADGERRLDVWRPIEAAIYASRPEFEQRGVALELSGSESEYTVFGDPAALEQLFLNLLLNAAEASSRGARTFITVTSESDSIAIRLEDEGPGISPNVRERIFEPLFSTKESGTGLGLTIARRIVEAHRGELEIHEGSKGGTIVLVRLPAATGEAGTGLSKV